MIDATHLNEAIQSALDAADRAVTAAEDFTDDQTRLDAVFNQTYAVVLAQQLK